MNPPPVADARANSILDADTAGAVQDPRTRAGRAAKRLRTSEYLHSKGLVTTPEIGDQIVYSASMTAAAQAAVNQGIPPLPPGTPHYIAALHNAIVGLNNNLNNRFNNIDARLNNIDARLANSVVTEGNDIIHPLINAAGLPPPPVYPATYADLLNLNNHDTRTLLLHYNLPINPQVTRNQRLRKFLGIKN